MNKLTIDLCKKNSHDWCQSKTLVDVDQKMVLEDIYRNKTPVGVDQK